MPLHDEIAVPADVLVRCPEKQFAMRQARRCEGCGHFKGLTERFSQGEHLREMRFEAQYAVRCAYPQDREVSRVTWE